MIYNKHCKCSVHSVQWGINERFGRKDTSFYTTDDKQKSHMGNPVKIFK